MDFTLDGPKLSKNIVAWSKRKGAVVRDLHTLAVSAVCHVIAFSDPRYVNQLDEACRDGIDTRGKTASGLHLSGLREYMIEKGGLKFVRKTADKTEHFAINEAKMAVVRETYNANPDGFRDNLMSTPFYHLKSQKDFEGFSIPRIVAAAVARLKKIEEDTEKSKHPGNDLRGKDMLLEIARKFAPVKKAEAAPAQA